MRRAMIDNHLRTFNKLDPDKTTQAVEEKLDNNLSTVVRHL